MPKDPMMLLSYVNTQLRDHYSSLDEFCSSEGATSEEIMSKLKSVGFEYNRELNSFK